MSLSIGTRATDEELRSFVGRLSDAPVTEVSIERQNNDFSTKLGSEFVTATTPGRVIRLFVKAVTGPAGVHAPEPRDRELRVYRDLADEPWFEGPRFLGVLGEGSMLVLEAVDGWDLRYQDLDDWAVATRALARLHAASHARVDELEGLDHLLRRDGAFHSREAEAAAIAVGADGEVSTRLKEVVSSYRPIADEVASLPLSLVHGDLAPKNVLMDRAGNRRALFVDWEWAGIGTGLLDLVDLINGLDRDDSRKLIDAYVAEARSGGLLPADDAFVARALELVELQRTMFRLSRAVAWGVPEEQIDAWARAAVDAFSRL
jgi:aminoglycoside phosphotransferase (APT) family kinase protein